MSRHKYPDGDFALAGANGAQGQSAAPKCRYPASKALTPLLAPKPAPRATLNRYSNSKTVATAEESKSPLLSAISFFSRLAKILADGNATPEFLASASAIRISLSCKTALKPGAIIVINHAFGVNFQNPTFGQNRRKAPLALWRNPRRWLALSGKIRKRLRWSHR